MAREFLSKNNASSKDISLWKGQDIISFQEDLQQKVKGSISEKSFYSYFKNAPEKLPRVDILNLLSQYCDYKNWNDFKATHSKDQLKNKKPVLLKATILLVSSLVLLTVIYMFTPKTNTFNFCFIDQDRKQPINTIPMDIIILNDQQSPFYTKSNSLGCFSWTTKDDFIQFVVQSPYHKTDTIYRIVSSRKNEEIQIRTDDYALMLHYYANGKIEDWEHRKQELSQLIAKDATIFQVLPHGLGIEMYSKTKFINTLTTPTEQLKNIEIIESKRLNGQIIKLKFRVRL